MKNKNSIIAFLVILVGVFTLEIIKYGNTSKQEYIAISKQILLHEAKSLYQNIVVTRKWASNHDAVYVKAHHDLKPNKYLKDNHTFTKEGNLLIKINPAWMTRQIAKLGNQESNHYFKITSLKPINPENSPDVFEKEALEFLQKHKEQNFFSKIREDKFNFLGTLKVEKSCLNCHHNQGYKENDIIGGIRISIPTTIYDKNIQMITSKTKIHDLVTIVTSILFLIIIIYTINSIYKREKKIKRLNKTLENKVEIRTKELKKANEKLLKISTIDDLTKIPNRRYFFEMANKTFYLSKRNHEIFSIICIDIDFFKKVNDTYGHQEGDKVLKTLSYTINTEIRKADTFARVGGEEFIILLNNTNKEKALLFAEKIRKKVGNITYKINNEQINITISLGISQYNHNDKNFEILLSRADQALYEAKNQGRNKTIQYKFQEK